MLGIDDWLGGLPPLTDLPRGRRHHPDSRAWASRSRVRSPWSAPSLLAASGVTNIWWVADRRRDRRDHRRLDRVLHRPPRRSAAAGTVRPAVPEALRPDPPGPGGEDLPTLGRVGRLLRPVRGAAADPGRPARRCAAGAVPQVPGRQRDRRHRLGVRHRVCRSTAVGHAAEQYLQDFSWVALVVAVLIGIATTLFLRRRAARTAAQLEAEELDSAK